jgi:hypothetical protein
MPNAAFDDVFSLQPKAMDALEIPSLSPAQQHLIIAADTTQIGAIAKARTGASFIIQGPPGTGKSQTITNLIADFAGCGKRVLFVCEKRAAIDVVFHRLRQQGLDELCCLIHDSQTDKKEFILNLKQSYEQWIATATDADQVDLQRNAALGLLEIELAALQKFTDTSVGSNPLLLRLIALRPTLDSEMPVVTDATPSYEDWEQGGDSVVRLAAALEDLGVAPVFAKHPLRWLKDLEASTDRLAELERRIEDLNDSLQETRLASEHWDTLDEIAHLLDSMTRLQPLARKNLLSLMDTNSEITTIFTGLRSAFATKRHALDAAQAKTTHWRDKLPMDETVDALEQAAALQGTFSFLNPSWWRLRKVLNQRYDFSKHAVKPSWSKVLADLSAEHQAQAELELVRTDCKQRLAGEELDELSQKLTHILTQDTSAISVALREKLLASPDGAALVEKLAGFASSFGPLRAELGRVLYEPDNHSLSMLATAMRDMQEEMDALPELLPALQDLARAPARLVQAVRTLPLTPAQLESACAAQSLEKLYRNERTLQRFDGHVLKQKIDQVASAHNQWLGHNAAWIRNQARKRFIAHLQTAHQPASALTAEQKIVQEDFHRGPT